MDARPKTRQVDRERKTPSTQVPRGAKQIVIPMTQQQYDNIWHDADRVRSFIEQCARSAPQLFPAGFDQSYCLHGFGRESLKLSGLKLRKIVLANGASYWLRPSFIFSSMTGTVDQLAYPLLLAAHGVPPWLLTIGFGHSDMYWYRVIERLGRNSLVGTTVHDSAQLPEHLVADEHHADWAGQKGYIPTTVGGGCILGSSVLKCEAWDFSLFCRSQSFCYHASGDVSGHGGAMARITIDVDLPPEVEITGYQRYQDGHGLEVRWPLPARCRCEKCGHDDVAHIEFKTIPQAIRDLNLWEQPCFWIYQAPFHRCARCNYRQHIIPPFKRKDVSYTYRFEQFVLRSLIGSTAEEVARRLGISAETVDRIVENQLTEDRQIDPQRVITDIGLDELSLKKRHRLYVTLMTDLSDPTRPQILAVERGRDTTATLKCLDRLTQEQRQQVRTHRVDMGPAYPAACALRLPHSRAVTDRFHVAKKFNEVVDSLRKNSTREYKAKLTKDQRKAFRSQMWAFRRDLESLSAEEKQALEALFEKIPALRPLYKVRLRFKEIFDTARDRITAARWLRKLRRECGQLGLDLGSFFETYDRWKTKILNYFDARQTSVAVEGINNKARVITKRTYGLKSAKSLWDRLILDLNRASQAIGYSIELIRQMAKGLKALFDWSCT